MYGQFGLWSDSQQIRAHFQFQNTLPCEPRYTIPPGRE